MWPKSWKAPKQKLVKVVYWLQPQAAIERQDNKVAGCGLSKNKFGTEFSLVKHV